MLVELKSAEATPEGVKISDVLGITDEKLDEIKTSLTNITNELSNAMLGKESSMNDGADVLKALNEMTPEGILFMAFVGITTVAEQAVTENPFEQLMRSMQGADDEQDCCEGSCKTSDENSQTPVVEEPTTEEVK